MGHHVLQSTWSGRTGGGARPARHRSTIAARRCAWWRRRCTWSHSKTPNWNVEGENRRQPKWRPSTWDQIYIFFSFKKKVIFDVFIYLFFFFFWKMEMAIKGMIWQRIFTPPQRPLMAFFPSSGQGIHNRVVIYGVSNRQFIPAAHIYHVTPSSSSNLRWSPD